MKKLIVLAPFLSLLCATAQNPISPPGVYIADPSARAWKDGRLYVYGSLDESTAYYCSHRYHVLSTEDMIHWTLHRNTFASRGEGDQVSYSDDLLWAPDCMEKDGRYYLYYCLADRINPEGVATSPDPEGPFTEGVRIDVGPHPQIDPCVFTDDDGQAYYLWGQFTAKMARLDPSMTAIDLSTVTDSILTEREHFFHEGAYLVKRNGIYYLLYAHVGRAGMPTCIGYSTSRSPMGPYRYGGVIIDNDHCDPGNWNNHGSIVEYRGQWYVFYHRATHGSATMRKACVEPIRFLEDGSIPEVEMTSQGAGGPLDAYDTIEAERACLLFGHVRIQAFGQAEEMLGEIGRGDRAAIKYIDFHEGATTVTVRLAPGEGESRIDLVAGMPWNKPFGTIPVAGTQGGEPWTVLSSVIQSPQGIHALWLRFHGDEKTRFAVDWIMFGH